MTLYEKIMELRKKNGMSQEDLGAEIGVSRQAISKWEMAQTTPDLNKIMALSELFGVSTDFLLKDEYDLTSLTQRSECHAVSGSAGNPAVTKDKRTEEKEVLARTKEETNHFIGLEEIQQYLNMRTYAAKRYVLSCFLFFMSPFTGLFLLLFDESKAIIGIVLQVIILMIAAVMILLTLSKLAEFKYLKNENNELAYGVRGVIEKKLEEFRHMHLIGIIIGIICIVGCVIPMMIVSAFTLYNDIAIVICGCLMLIIFASGLSSIIYVQFVNRGYKIVLQMK